MSAWLATAFALLVALAACGWRCAAGSTPDRVIALVFAGEISTLVLVALAVAYHRDFYIDCALAAALLPYPCSIVYAHFFEKWV